MADRSNGEMARPSPGPDRAVLRHVVLLGFRAGTAAETVAAAEARFAALARQVPGVAALEWGRDASPEGLANGHSHVFTLTFAGAAARDAYLVHPDHVAFAAWLRPHVGTLTVLDYSPEVTP